MYIINMVYPLRPTHCHYPTHLVIYTKSNSIQSFIPSQFKTQKLGFLFLSCRRPNSCLSPSHFRNHSSSSSSLRWRRYSLSPVSLEIECSRSNEEEEGQKKKKI
ncbi:hypothetical protein HanRHA438_Chr10g0450301 [Helianthus annuus]|uniref:Uncharacterized protein n=1 Tax=Helianthus annuus TaxID=4232 RepID=A0A251TNK4_HELAN|nr:hypothetical protein HanXRQr2_Chr10g0438271 [Helianthus annuus]KAJ0879341.1 hypothetical protein HanRHA438_Chr10g0450301 [Helianthus annuus]KAJ0883575.1 hypothetical protein HanPSC8_Chr10g0423171 [Helianthus annuus]